MQEDGDHVEGNEIIEQLSPPWKEPPQGSKNERRQKQR